MGIRYRVSRFPVTTLTLLGLLISSVTRINYDDGGMAGLFFFLAILLSFMVWASGEFLMSIVHADLSSNQLSVLSIAIGLAGALLVDKIIADVLHHVAEKRSGKGDDGG